jgi:hypothetical protein
VSRLTIVLLMLVLSGLASAETLYDPTRPPVGVSAPAPEAAPAAAVPLQVNFIINAAERRLARINGRWVGEGDHVAGAEVVRIESGHVRLRRDGRLFDLPLRGGGVQKRPSDPAG